MFQNMLLRKMLKYRSVMTLSRAETSIDRIPQHQDLRFLCGRPMEKI